MKTINGFIPMELEKLKETELKEISLEEKE
jgi:hypothetical protein